MIVLMGVPRSGKTSLGRLLASKLNVPFYDLDELVLKECTLLSPKIDTVRTLVKLYGQEKLRALEKEVLTKFQNKHGVLAGVPAPGVLALGGGTLLTGGSLPAVTPEGMPSGVYVHLALSFEEFLNRVLVKPLPLTCDTRNGWYLGLMSFYTTRYEACKLIAHKTLDVANRNTSSCILKELLEMIPPIKI